MIYESKKLCDSLPFACERHESPRDLKCKKAGYRAFCRPYDGEKMYYGDDPFCLFRIKKNEKGNENTKVFKKDLRYFNELFTAI